MQKVYGEYVCMKYALECSNFDCIEKMESAGLANGCIFFNLRIFTMVIFYFIVLIFDIFFNGCEISINPAFLYLDFSQGISWQYLLNIFWALTRNFVETWKPMVRTVKQYV